MDEFQKEAEKRMNGALESRGGLGTYVSFAIVLFIPLLFTFFQ